MNTKTTDTTEKQATPREIKLQRIVDELNDTSAECLAAVDELRIIRLERENRALVAALEAIAEIPPAKFSRDRLEHATSTIEKMQEIAQAALAAARAKGEA